MDISFVCRRIHCIQLLIYNTNLLLLKEYLRVPYLGERTLGKVRNTVIQTYKIINIFYSMKNKNIKYLKDYETDMITALFHSYTRQLPQSTLIEMDRIYTEETGKTLRTNFSCSGCILKLMKEVGKLYFKENIDSLPDDLKDKFNTK